MPNYTKQQLKFMHINVRSLTANFNNFKDFVSGSQWDIIAVTETWLDANISSDSLNLNGYFFLRKDRASRGGGVGLYVANYLKYDVIETNSNIEQLWINLYVKCKKIICGVIYRPPHFNCNSFLDELETSYSKCLPISSDIFCFGDVNIDMLNIELQNTIQFNNLISELDLVQLISDPTRTAQNTATLIDVILASNKNCVLDSGVINYNYSDHDAVFCHSAIKVLKPEPILRQHRNLKNINPELFYRDDMWTQLNAIYFTDNIDSKLKLLNDTIIQVFDKYAPIRLIKLTKSPSPWLNDDIRKLMSNRDKAKERYKKSRTLEHWETYKHLRNQTTSVIRVEKKAYFKSVTETRNSSIIWKSLNNLNLNKTKVPIPPHLSNVNDINQFFLNSIPKFNNDHSDLTNYYKNNFHANVPLNLFTFQLVDLDKILSALNKIKTNSIGSDGINLEMIKMCFPIIQYHLLNIINSCILEKYFPNEWKIAQVIPIPKCNKVEEYKDLRPISILPTFSKLLESILNAQLREYLGKNNILPVHQSGFRPQHSCTTALLHITDDILRANDEGKLTLLVLLDYSKAFDSIDHDIMAAIFHYLGLSRDSIQLLCSYLLNRIQSTKIDNTTSDPMQLTLGVPQGSILGPLLFCLYTTNFHKYVRHCKMHMYADDTQLYLSFKPEELNLAVNILNSDLDSILKASNDHALTLNASKTKVLLFGTSNLYQKNSKNIKLKLDNVELEIVTEAKNLGLWMDNSFRYKLHVSKCIQKAYSCMRLMYPHRTYLSTRIKTILCETIVLSQFSYCSSVYNFCLDSLHKNKIQKVQNSCLRFIFGIKKYDHVSHKLREVQWLNMQNRFTLQASTLFHSIILNEKPGYLYDKIITRSNIHNVNVRNKNALAAPSHKTSQFERSFTYNIYKIYNGLDNSLKSLKVSAFKKHMRELLLKKQHQAK